MPGFVRVFGHYGLGVWVLHGGIANPRSVDTSCSAYGGNGTAASGRVAMK